MTSEDSRFLAALIYLQSQDQQTPLASNPKHANRVVPSEADLFHGATRTYDNDDDHDPETESPLPEEVFDGSIKNRFLDTIAHIFAREAKLLAKQRQVLRHAPKVGD